MRQTTILFFLSVCLASMAQTALKPFRAHLRNDEYKVDMRINFYEQDITIPGQELFGQMAGYLSKEGTSYCWLVVEANIEKEGSSESKATLIMSNDFGSEDFKAELTAKGDTAYVLRHLGGSVLKVPNNGKWQKLPKIIELKRKNKR